MDRFVAMLAFAALALTGPVAARTLEITETAHELTLGDITLPGSTVGTLIFRTCETCDPQALRVNPDTAYISPQGPMALADFHEYVAETRLTPNANENTYVTVFRSADDGRVTRIKLHGSD